LHRGGDADVDVRVDGLEPLANDGATLTVSTPLRPATLMLSMAVERPSNAARMPGRQAPPASVSTSWRLTR
jgi:hypothetical protein